MMETVQRREEEGREGTVRSSKARSKLQEVHELRPVSLLLCRSRENHLLQDDLCPEVTAGKSVQPRMKGHLLNKTSFFFRVFHVFVGLDSSGAALNCLVKLMMGRIFSPVFASSIK